MSDIYSSAAHVIVWRFYTLFPPYIFDDCDALGAVLKASWNTRVWALQEVVLARRATVRAGPGAVRWSKLERLANVNTAKNAVSGFTRYPGDAFARCGR
ncbi:hypothetical protein N657DRAFT_643177 [Parathielavia appendiculata]|uniref:Heterokaryon incompatibility domain-containing protein n=1 Tax=Parathielavia appendiculata TaxID=2587402 RepID=A0AAN6U506_9PEZI|nr:hypothetical protein N657DRAFT_643177 [Parathielavia appendiculata]